jgi:hypothetical protein
LRPFSRTVEARAANPAAMRRTAMAPIGLLVFLLAVPTTAAAWKGPTCYIDATTPIRPRVGLGCLGAILDKIPGERGPTDPAETTMWTGPTCSFDLTSWDRPRVGLGCLDSWGRTFG